MTLVKTLKGARQVYLGSIFVSFFNIIALYAFVNLIVTTEYIIIHMILCLLALRWWKRKQIELMPMVKPA